MTTKTKAETSDRMVVLMGFVDGRGTPMLDSSSKSRYDEVGLRLLARGSSCMIIGLDVERLLSICVVRRALSVVNQHRDLFSSRI